LENEQAEIENTVWTIFFESGIMKTNKKFKSTEGEKYTGYKPQREQTTGCKPARQSPVEVHP